MKTRILFFVWFAIPLLCHSQDIEEKDFKDKSFLIIASFKKYDDAYTIARQAANKLQLAMPGNGEYGSSFRGHYNDDDSAFITIEQSHMYSRFKKDLYIVVVATSLPGNKNIKLLLKKVRKIYPDAYIKTSPVYVGHIH